MTRGKIDPRNGGGTGYAAPASTPLVGLAATFAFAVLVGTGLMEGWPQPTPWLKHDPAVLATLDLAPPPPPSKAEPPSRSLKVPPAPPEALRAQRTEARSHAAAPHRRLYSDATAASPAVHQSAAMLQPNPPQSPTTPTVAPTSTPLPPALPKAAVVRADNAALRQSYAAKLWARIAARRPQGVHMAGSAKVQFTLNMQGRLINVTLARSSGNPLLDKMALTTVRRAQPFSAPPPTLAADDLTFLVDFNFDDL